MRELTFLKSFIFDKDRKSIFQILRDLNYLGRGENNLNISNYFQSMMYKKDSGNISNYFNGELMHKIILSYNKRGKHPVLENKVEFAKLLSKNNIPVAKFLGEIKNSQLIIPNSSSIQITDVKKFTSVIKILLEKEKVIFIKPVDALGGKGILKLNLGEAVSLNKINQNSNYIIEKGLNQHAILNQLNPSSLNSLRVMTLKHKGVNTVVIPSCFFRVGREGSHVDNAAAGGIFLDYDLKTNELGPIAYTHAGSGGQSYTKHPDTEVLFKGFKLPFPEKVEKLVTKAALLFDDLEMIGWDIGFTDEGPVIIEGNSNPSLLMMQITQKGLYKNKYYKKYYNDLL